MPTAVAADPTVLANRLRPVLLQLNRQLRREIHSLGVTGGQVSLLVQIKYHPGIGIRELAALERMSVPGMSKFISRLEEAGLVQRAPVEGDQRRVGLTLTPAGHRSCGRSSRGGRPGSRRVYASSTRTSSMRSTRRSSRLRAC